MKKHLILLAILSGLLFSLAWPARGIPVFLFLAWIPMLWMEDRLCESPQKYHSYHALLFAYPGFFVWNLLTTWWVYNSTPFGGIMAVLFNSLFMTLVFWAYHMTKKRFFGAGKGYFILVIYWIAFEVFHQEWDLTWSWLNLGNGFAAVPAWVQWYEYTGIFGGALWIFAANLLGYQVFKGIMVRDRKKGMRKGVVFLAVILLPLGFSLLRFYTYREVKDPVEVVVVQPNIDPYKEQYSLPSEVVMDRMLTLADQAVDSTTQLLICPESAIQEDIWENEPLFMESPSVQTASGYISKHRGMGVVMGASTYKRYDEGESISETARYSKANNFYYEAYNTALYLDSSGKHQLYHKSKLVVGVERMPFPKYLKFLEKYALDLGGTIGSLGLSPERTVFSTHVEGLGIGTAICYESVYGDFFRRFVKNGASMMLIITNDGWWGNSPGHRQHLGFSSLRAIETRRCIARSANTGISCFVDQKGIFHQVTPYWEPAVIKASLNLNHSLTLYVRYGDVIGLICSWTAALLLISTLLYRWFPAGFRRVTSSGR